MQTPERTVRWPLLIVLMAVIWLVPAVYWHTVGKGTFPDFESRVMLGRPADSYYSMVDRRCYALVYTGTVPISHNLGESPAKLSLVASGQWHIINENLPDGQMIPVVLQPGKQVLVAEDSAGRRATLGVHYLPSASSTLPLTRTLVVSISDLGTSATYVAEAEVGNISQELDDLIAGEIEPGLFIKRVFYPGQQPGIDLSRCNRPPVTSTMSLSGPITVTGGELSTIHPPALAVSGDMVRVTLEASVSGWRYDRHTPVRLLSVSPARDGFTRVTLVYNQGKVWDPDPFPTSWDDLELAWVNPATPISVKYEPGPPLNVTVQGRNLAPALINRLRPALKAINGYHFVFSLLITLAAPLLPLVWLWLLCKRDLAGVLPGLVNSLRLGAFMWLGPLGAMFVSNALGHSVSHASAALWAAVWGSGLVVSLLSSPVTFPSLTSRMAVWIDQRRVAVWLCSLLMVVGLAGLLWVLLASLKSAWRHPLALPLVGLLLALTSWSLVSPLTRRENGLTIPPTVWIAWTVLLVLLAVPLPDTAYLFEPETGWPIETDRYPILLWGFFVLPYLGLLGGIAALKVVSADYPPSLGLSRLMFIFLVGFTGVFPQVLPEQVNAVSPFWLSPVPFILAWLVFRALAQPASALEVGPYVFKKRKELLGYAITSGGVIRDVVLSFGAHQGTWENSRLCTRYGFALGTVLALTYGILLLPSVADQLNTPFLPLMMLVAFVMPIFLRWVLAGFFLGYFFTRLPGRSGAMKGFWLACAIAACVFAYDLLFRVRSSADLQSFLATDVVLTVLGLMGIGATLDYHTIRRAGYNWQQLLALYRVPYLAGYLSALLAAILSTTVSVINGQIATLGENLANAILRTYGG